MHYCLSLYNTLILPYFNCGIISWHKYPHYALNRLVTCQKKAVRALCSLDYNAHTNDYFKWNKILKVHDLYKLNICSLFYRYTQPSVDLPSAVRLQTISSIHTYNTRHNHNLLTPRYNLTKSQSSFLYNSTHAWNSIPPLSKTVIL